MMQLLYNSENYSVATIQLCEINSNDVSQIVRGGYEIVDKLTGRGIYLEGDLAEKFQHEIQQIAHQSSQGEDLEAYLQNYEVLMHQVVQN